MAVSQMKKVQIFTHNVHRESLIKDLQDLEVVHINDLSEQKESADDVSADTESRKKSKELQNDLSLLKSTIDYLADFEQKGGLLAGFLGGKPTFSFQEYTKMVNQTDENEWRGVCNECQSIQELSVRLASREGRLHSEKENLSLWSNLDVAIEDVRDTGKTAIRIGIVPVSTFDNLLLEAKESNLNVFFDVVGRSRNDVNVVVIFLKADEPVISPMLAKHGFSLASLPISSGKISDRMNQIDKEIHEIADQRNDATKKSGQLAQYRTKLMVIYDHINELLSQERIKDSFANTDYTFIVDGWIRKKNINDLQEKLSKKYNEIEIVVSDPSDDEEPPVDLSNQKIASPYEMVTRLYGIPRYREIDPTPLLAPFLTLGFAICLTDAGYGIVVGLIALFAIMKMTGGNKKLFGILAICGLTTLIVGALTGGWFGISGDKLPQFLLKIRVIDPNTQQLLFLGLIVVIGFIQVWFGFVVKLYICLKERDWLGAFCDQLPWVATMVFAPVLIMIMMGRISAPSFVGAIIKVILGLCFLTILLFAGREIKNPAGRLGTGFFELYSKITGTFGDSLSYMRLFALGLATGIIASSINTIAGMLWTNPVGKVGAIAVLVFGHPFNIVINALGGFIHSTRLQFVEFFTKFYEGGGKEFQPFRKEHIYLTVLDTGKSKSAQ